jgi:pantetheine-phosphate adenylyltransferase
MKTTAVYPGTFDPITNGHVDLISRAAKIFPHVVVLVAADTKKKPLFSLDERLEMVREAVKGCCKPVKVEPFHGLLVDSVPDYNSGIIIRGLRAVSDFEYESMMALMNRRLSAAIETFFMISAEEYAYLSSSFVKEIAGLKGDVDSMVPEAVAVKLKEAYGD